MATQSLITGYFSSPGPSASAKAQVSTENIEPPPSLNLKRKFNPSEQSPSPPASPRHFKRAASFISISSDNDDDYDHSNGANQVPTSLSARNAPAPAPATEPNLCKEQQDLIDLIMSGRNVFFTGSAGCGKSTVLKAAVKKLRDHGRTVYVTAPTGRAAVQVGGMTTWSYMGWYPDLLKDGISKIMGRAQNKIVKKRIRQTDVLIIDEISMVDSDHLQRINECMKAVRHYDPRTGGYAPGAPPFGGVQVIVTGDFCQLPPVNPFQWCYYCGAGGNNMFSSHQEENCNKREAEYNCVNNCGPFYEKDKWAFRSSAWEEAKFAHVNLEEIHRQNDESFIKMLQKCRLGIPFSDDEVKTLTNHECEVHNGARLLCTKKEVDPINKNKYNQITRYDERSYRVFDTFNWNGKNPYDRTKYGKRERDGTLSEFKEHQFDPVVKLKETMLVMLQVNLDIKRGLVNGSQGVVCGWEKMDIDNLPGLQGDQSHNREIEVEEFLVQHISEHRDSAMHYWPRVRFSNGIKRTIYPWCVVNTVGDTQPYSRILRTQIPLVPGWAITVHRSQGMTLDRVIVDLTNAFEEGQVYVALSRATGLRGLKVEENANGLRVGEGGNQDVREFLMAKFGDRLFRNHAGSTVGPSNRIEGGAS